MSVAKVQAIRKYRCGNCATVHKRESSAESCCEPDIETVFCCPGCEKEHESEPEAVGCCAGLTAKERAELKIAESEPQCFYCPIFLTIEDIHESLIVGSRLLCNEHRPAISMAA